MGTADRRFNSEEVSAIIRRALTSKSGHDEVDYDDLVEIARQSGISPAKLEAALREEAELGEYEKAREEWMRTRRQHFMEHFRAYVIVNGALILMNLMTWGYPWAIWPIVGWGIGLAFDASDSLWPKECAIERGAKKILRKREKDKMTSAIKGKLKSVYDSFNS